MVTPQALAQCANLTSSSEMARVTTSSRMTLLANLTWMIAEIGSSALNYAKKPRRIAIWYEKRQTTISKWCGLIIVLF